MGVGVFPEREEIFVGDKRPDAGGIGIGSLRSSRLPTGRTAKPSGLSFPLLSERKKPRPLSDRGLCVSQSS